MSHGAPAPLPLSAYRNLERNLVSCEAAHYRVAIVGAGVLGKCIAVDLSLQGVQVTVIDRDPNIASMLSTSAYELLTPLLHLGYITKRMVTEASNGINFVSDLSGCAEADVVLEAIPDDLTAKTKLFQELEKICSLSTVLATSTINLTIDSIQSNLVTPERFLGVRFFYPCLLVSPVEITVGSDTSAKSVDQVLRFLSKLEKRPHRGPTKQVLTEEEAKKFQFNASVSAGLYHGLLKSKLVDVSRIIQPAAGPPFRMTDEDS